MILCYCFKIPKFKIIKMIDNTYNLSLLKKLEINKIDYKSKIEL